MSEEELLQRSRETTDKHILHWVSEIYGFGAVIRTFGYYPSSWPLNIYLAHGITVDEKPAAHELNNFAPVMLYFSPRLVDAFKRVSSKPCYCLLSPNVFYRRFKRITINANPKGTIAFLAHTTAMIEDKMNLIEYAEQLKKLPQKYQPVSVCLHYHDVNKGVHKVFYNKGLDVVTVGNPMHDSFIERFYELVRKYRYATSNEVGSYMFYTVEMGIPFFLYGIEPDLYNHGDPNIESGKYDSYKRTNQYKKIKELFSNPVDAVTAIQRTFVEEELGVSNSISRLKMASILYASYFELTSKKLKIKIHRIVTLRSLKRFVKHRLWPKEL